MFFYDPNDPDNCVAIKPLQSLLLRIVDVIDKDCNIVKSTINANEDYTYLTSLEGRERFKWCFWIEKRDNDFEKNHIIKINPTKKDREEAKNNFFLTSKAEGDERKKENTKLLAENAILSATITTEINNIGAKKKTVDVLKVTFSKWLEGEKVCVEVYHVGKEPTRDTSKEAVKSRTIAVKEGAYFNIDGSFSHWGGNKSLHVL